MIVIDYNTTADKLEKFEVESRKLVQAKVMEELASDQMKTAVSHSPQQSTETAYHSSLYYLSAGLLYLCMHLFDHELHAHVATAALIVSIVSVCISKLDLALG